MIACAAKNSSIHKTDSLATGIWSVGCIFGSLLKRTPLFPGTNADLQLTNIFSLIGSPSPEEISGIPNLRTRGKVASMLNQPAKDFSGVFRKATPLAVHLLERLLTFDPDKRITAEEACNIHI